LIILLAFIIRIKRIEIDPAFSFATFGIEEKRDRLSGYFFYYSL
jgi:hypothetical protein